jgi:hypothetical protein
VLAIHRYKLPAPLSTMISCLLPPPTLIT